VKGKKMDDDKGIFSCLGMIVGAVIVIIVGALIGGYVLAKMWLWFIVPFGAPEIEIAHAIGISLLAGLFTSSSSSDDKYESTAEVVTKLIATLIAPFILLGFGWIVVQFM
jgi:hypothetical protein